MTHLIEILLIVSIITSVIMLMLLIILKVGVTVTSRPLTKEKIEKLENRKWSCCLLYTSDAADD